MLFDLDMINEGNYEYERGTLTFSVPKIDSTIYPGEILRGVFAVHGSGMRKLEGYVFPTTPRMRLSKEYFVGESVSIEYEFDSMGLEEGDVHKGELQFITNKGEHILAYVITMQHTVLQSSLGGIKNLFHFTNLAKSQWEEAVKLFYSKEFTRIFVGNDKHYQLTYQGLSASYGNQQNLEEFLLQINKKSKIEYLVDQEEIVYEGVYEILGGEITITRNGWGYTCLQIEAIGDFLTTEKEKLTDDDFLGNLCRLRFFVDASRLHSGNNLGKIRLISPYFVKEVTLTVKQQYDAAERRRIAEEKRITAEMMEAYIHFRTKHTSLHSWIKQTMLLVDRLLSIYPESIMAHLYQVQLLMTEERFNEAKWVLDHVDDRLRKGAQVSLELRCYHSYLTTLYNREPYYVNKVADDIEILYGQNPNNWRLGWLLLYLKEEYSRSPEKKWRTLEQQFHRGCYSPVLYIEALVLIQASPILLLRLTDFEQHILTFAAKRDLLKKEMVDQIIYLVARERQYSHRIYEILKVCYGKSPTDEILSTICSYLIKGNCVGDEYFVWYSRAVARELRILRLYEYYMMSIPLEFREPLPRMVLMYFAYQCNLSVQRTAMLYANLLRNADAYPDLVRQYEQQMMRFVNEQVRKASISKDLAYLYRQLLTSEQLMCEDVATAIAPLLFTHMLSVADERIHKVIVIHGKMKGEMVYTITKGEAYIPIYGNDYRILLQDCEGNRYLDTVPCKLEKLMLPGKLAKEIAPCVREQVGFAIYLCEESRSHITIQVDNLEHYCNLLRAKQVCEEYKMQIRSKLLKYYYETDRIREMDQLLNELQPDGLNTKERAEYITYMIDRGMFDKARAWIAIYGAQEISAKSMVRFLTKMMHREEFVYADDLLALSYGVYKSGKYDESTMKYLAAHFRGSAKEMSNIWKAAQSFYVDTQPILEKILTQMLFSGAFVGEINQMYAEYCRQGAKRDLEVAFLSHYAYLYFVKDHLPEVNMMKSILQLYRREGKVSTPCRLAILKYYHEHPQEISQEAQKEILILLEESVRKQQIFPFFFDIPVKAEVLDKYRDRTYVEHKAAPDLQVVIHYVIEFDGDHKGEYHKEEMRDVYGGIRVKGFVLFFGENLQYYITEETAGEEQLVESSTLQRSDTGSEVYQGLYYQLNYLSVSIALEDYETARALIAEHLQRRYLSEKLFYTI